MIDSEQTFLLVIKFVIKQNFKVFFHFEQTLYWNVQELKRKIAYIKTFDFKRLYIYVYISISFI